MIYNLITVLGPTAVGKTRLAARLASKYEGEIISADSRQVYIGMDIGTGKDLADYSVNGRTVPVHLIDLISAREEFDLFHFMNSFYESFDKISANGKTPFLVGGTGLYLHSILKEYSLKMVDFNSPRFIELNALTLEELTIILKEISTSLHNTTDLLIKERVIKAIIIEEEKKQSNRVERTKICSLNIGLSLSREEIKKRITDRLKYRLENGMIDEVQSLIQNGVSFEKLEYFGLEYRYISKYISGELNYNDMFQKLNSAIHLFAKRQMTWFRKMEKEGIEIKWIDGADVAKAQKIINRYYFQTE